MGDITTEVTEQHFEALRSMFGNHTLAACALGVTQRHYAYVRQTGKMSGPLRRLILSLCNQSFRPLASQPQDGAA